MFTDHTRRDYMHALMKMVTTWQVCESIIWISVYFAPGNTVLIIRA